MHDVPVFQDRASGVIFIADHYVGDSVYESANYKQDFNRNDYEGHVDLRRRLATFESFIVGRRICDFGCGTGDFLLAARRQAASVAGVELRKSTVRDLIEQGVAASASIGELKGPFDTIFLFHSLEHLLNPVEALSQCREALAPGGRIVVEVPHARDFLLDALRSEAFASFTLWSQHLVLHTRMSLRVIGEASGLAVKSIVGVQRYSLSNHLHWLTAKEPGGHRSSLHAIETPQLVEAYAAALARANVTDTLVVVYEYSDRAQGVGTT